MISWVLLCCHIWEIIHFQVLKAGATIDEVNTLWKGLGYYSRASRILAGAQKAVAEYGGRLPDNAKDMEAKIPGIGRYSAGAICSIAYGERVPVVCLNYRTASHRLLTLYSLMETCIAFLADFLLCTHLPKQSRPLIFSGREHQLWWAQTVSTWLLFL